MIWDAAELTDHDIIVDVLNRFWNIQNEFQDFTKSLMDRVPALTLPQRIRFGIAAGHVYPIDRNGEMEYVGVCINLASRLQKYCPKLSFVASTSIDVDMVAAKKQFYSRVVAKDIRGFPPELVLVDERGYKRLKTEDREALFGNS